MIAIVLALAASVSFGISDFLGGTLSRRTPTATVLFLGQSAALALLLPIALIVGVQLQWASVGWGIGSGLAAAIGLGSLFRGLAIGTMGVVAPVSALGVLVPVGVGLADGQSLTVALAVGMAVAVVGTVLAAGPQRRDRSIRRPSRQSIILALVSALAFGTANLCTARGSTISLATTVGVGTVVTFVTYGLAVLITRKTLRVARSDIPWIVIVGFGSVGGALLFGAASRLGELAIVAVLAALYPAITAALGWRILGERLRRIQVVGVVAIFGGVALIAGRA